MYQIICMVIRGFTVLTFTNYNALLIFNALCHVTMRYCLFLWFISHSEYQEKQEKWWKYPLFMHLISNLLDNLSYYRWNVFGWTVLILIIHALHCHAFDQISSFVIVITCTNGSTCSVQTYVESKLSNMRYSNTWLLFYFFLNVFFFN